MTARLVCLGDRVWGVEMAYSIKGHALLKDNQSVDFIESPYVGGPLPKDMRILVMHFTYGASGRSSAEWFRSPDNPGSSAHVVVDRDGSVIQCVKFGTVAWHAGNSRWKNLVGLNKFAIGIEVANWGYLRPSGAGWSSHTGVSISNPVLAIHKNGNPNETAGPIGWEPYSEAQFEASAAIARALISAYGIDEIVGHDDISPGRKWDPGPAFDFDRFRTVVFGGDADEGDSRLVVAVAEGLNLRAGPGTGEPVIILLPAGTLVEPLARSGQWLNVSVIGEAGEPTYTGWVHGHYLATP